MRSAEPNVVVAAFTEEQVERLTGVSKRQLRYWDRTGFFQPTFGSEERRGPYSRIYSFKDVASLRVLNVLRNKYEVPLQHLRSVAAELAHLSDEKWTSLQLFVRNKRVVLVEPGTEKFREIVGGQYTFGIALNVVVSDTKRSVAKLLRRDEASIGKIERSRYVSRNAWVIAGTRIPVESIRRLSEDGYSIEQIREEYPTLTRADIEAALRHGRAGLAA